MQKFNTLNNSSAIMATNLEHWIQSFACIGQLIVCIWLKKFMNIDL